MTRRRAGAQLRPHGQLEAGQHGDQLITASIGPDGSAVALWAAPIAAAALAGRTTDSSGVSFAASVLDRPVSVRVTVHQPGRPSRTTAIAELRLAHPSVAALPDGELLLVGARCLWSPAGAEPNAAIYSTGGDLIREGVVGDGVGQVCTTTSGAIWIGYSDEGIFGNYGWGLPGPAPIGQSGLVRFDGSFHVSWEFPRDAGSPVEDSPYVNVAGETVWACYHSTYPIVRVEGDSLTSWRNETGSRGVLLVDDELVALVGRHVVLGRLEAERGFRPFAATQLDLPADPPRRRTQLIGRGPVLHAISPGGHWSVTDLATLGSAACDN